VRPPGVSPFGLSVVYIMKTVKYGIERAVEQRSMAAATAARAVAERHVGLRLRALTEGVLMRRVRRVELIGGLVGAALVAGGGAVALASPAWAAGSGYLPPSTFTVGNVPGGFSQVVTT